MGLGTGASRPVLPSPPSTGRVYSSSALRAGSLRFSCATGLLASSAAAGLLDRPQLSTVWSMSLGQPWEGWAHMEARALGEDWGTAGIWWDRAAEGEVSSHSKGSGVGRVLLLGRTPKSGSTVGLG